MGGGDLNSKKSWHPNTIKNQERVWKAEQAAAEEKKRIIELQRERAEERDRAELNEMVKRNASSTADSRLNWMYDKPDKKGQDEDYLLGKSIEKSYGHSERDEQDVIPAVARRVVGSSMLTSTGDGQVDLARKIREDPLLLVKERERAARAALLNNPLQRRRLADLLRKEQEQRKHKVKKKSKKKGKDLDEKLAAKLSALGGDKGVDIAKLLDSDSESSSDSDDKHSKKKKIKKGEKLKKQSKKSKKKVYSDFDESSSDGKYKQSKSKHSKGKNVEHAHSHESSKHKSETEVLDYDSKKKRENSYKREHNKSYGPTDSSEDEKFQRKKSIPKYHSKIENNQRRKSSDDERVKRMKSMPKNHKKTDKEPKGSSDDGSHERRKSIPKHYKRMDNKQRDSSDHEPRDTGDDERYRRNKSIANFNKRTESEKRKGLSEEEKAAKLAAMAAAGAEREVQRGRRVAAQRRADAADAARAPPGLASGSQARALPDSLESRIHSNRHYIQRDRHHMNENFARR